MRLEFLVFYGLSLIALKTQAVVTDSTIQRVVSKHPFVVSARVNSNFELSALNGNSVLFGQHVSAHEEWRMGVGFYYIFRSNRIPERVVKEYGEGRLWLTDNFLSCALSISHCWYFAPIERVIPYIALGGLFECSFDRFRQTEMSTYYQYPIVNESYVSGRNEENRFGLIGSVGAEYFISSHVSLGGEFQLTATQERFVHKSHTKSFDRFVGENGPFIIQNENTDLSFTDDSIRLKLWSGFFMISVYM